MSKPLDPEPWYLNGVRYPVEHVIFHFAPRFEYEQDRSKYVE